METGQTLNTLRGHTGCVNSINLSSYGSKIISGSDDQTIKVWEMETGVLIKTLEGGHNGCVVCIGTTFNHNFFSKRASDCYKISNLNILQYYLENMNVLNNEMEKREQDVIHIQKDRILFLEENL